MKAVGSDVATEEQNPFVSENLSGEIPEVSPEPAVDSAEAPNSSTTTTSGPKRSRAPRKSEMPPVKNEELVPGAYFTGKVKSVQPFGAFIDFGAFTEGLIHISKLSNEYVKDVSSVVSVGEEVKVKIIEVNIESQRIALMRETDDPKKPQQRKEASDGTDYEKPRTGRKNAAKPNKKRDGPQKRSKFVMGQVLDGTVKSLVRTGAFISLPSGEEGFLPISEESEEFGTILGKSSLQVGQEVEVRVLQIARGRLTLTMKKEEDVESISTELIQGEPLTATNPFVVAFRKNKDIASFLEERERRQKLSETLTSEELKEASENQSTESIQSSALQLDNLTASDPSSLESSETVASSESSEALLTEEKSEIAMPHSVQRDVPEIPEVTAPSADPIVPEASVSTETQKPDSSSLELPETAASSNSSEALITEEKPEIATSNSAQLDAAPSARPIDPEASLITEIEKPNIGIVTSEDDKSDAISDSLNSQNISTSVDSPGSEESIEVTESASLAEDANHENKDSSTEISDSSDVSVINTSESVVEKEAEVTEIKDGVSVSTADLLEDPNVTDEAASESTGSVDAKEQVLPSDPKVSVDPQPGDLISNEEKIEASSHAEPTMVDVSSPDENLGTDSESGHDVSASSDEESSFPQNDSPKASISPALVKQLREETGAGMMDCKKALAATNGDIAKAQEYLRKKGLAGADKKASRVTAEGRVGSYIHDSRIGVLVEVNCETDFVSRGEIFKELVDDLAMQVAACPQVQYLTMEDVPEEIVNKEREIEMQKEDLLSKPEQMRSKIVDGRIRKRLQEFALLEQPYIKNDKVSVGDLVKQTIATLGENIKVKRFSRFNLGEGLEKKSQDFAAEVAAQTAVKSTPQVPNEPPAQSKETSDTAPIVAISAALVKQLREETGAGMMDCKKALAETDGDLQKAQEYLRKKGLSSADKKSSRLAAEGTVGSYIHDSRIGVLIEVNCETDFVAQNDKFKELVSDLAMQVVACPEVQFVSLEDIPQDIVSKEKEIEMQREDLQSKPENIREKIVEGRVSKRLSELALLEQPFIKDDGVLVKDLVKQTVAALGENIRVRRFVRYTLGE